MTTTMTLVMMAASDDAALVACGGIRICNGRVLTRPNNQHEVKGRKWGEESVTTGGDKIGWLDMTPWDKGGVREEGSIHNNQQMVGGERGVWQKERYIPS
jgi:hypothetical protein